MIQYGQRDGRETPETAEQERQTAEAVSAFLASAVRDRPQALMSRIPIRVLSCSARQEIFRYEAEIGPELENVWGIAHGGLLAAVFDTCMGCSIWAAGGGRGSRTVSLRMNYLRPVPLGVTLQVAVRVVRRGRRLAVAEGEAWLGTDRDRLTDTADGIFALEQEPSPGGKRPAV